MGWVSLKYDDLIMSTVEDEEGFHTEAKDNSCQCSVCVSAVSDRRK